MAQIKDYQNDANVLNELHENCLLCGEKKPYRIFYALPIGTYYICEDCEDTVRGLYSDVVFERSERESKSIDEVISEFSKKVHSIKELRSKNDMFKYYLDGGIIDSFDPSFTTKNLIELLPQREEEIRTKEKQIIKLMESKEGEKPHTIRFFWNSRF